MVTEAEYTALTYAMKETLWLKKCYKRNLVLNKGMLGFGVILRMLFACLRTVYIQSILM